MFTATYRVGNGRARDIGADSLIHIALALPEITLVGIRCRPLVGGIRNRCRTCASAPGGLSGYRGVP